MTCTPYACCIISFVQVLQVVSLGSVALWQLGIRIKTAAGCADVATTSFADHLLAGNFATAAIAQASLW